MSPHLSHLEPTGATGVGLVSEEVLLPSTLQQENTTCTPRLRARVSECGFQRISFYGLLQFSIAAACIKTDANQFETLTSADPLTF